MSTAQTSDGDYYAPGTFQDRYDTLSHYSCCLFCYQTNTGSQNSHGWYRSKQWLYLGPIIAAPITHICVTMYRNVSPLTWLLQHPPKA
jgi:hypothetical protein